jgi:hypothetical protein
MWSHRQDTQTSICRSISSSFAIPTSWNGKRRLLRRHGNQRACNRREAADAFFFCLKSGKALMAVDIVYLKAHFADLADEDLLRISSGELVPEARRVMNQELSTRKLELPRMPAAASAESLTKPTYVSGVALPPFDLSKFLMRAFLGLEPLWRVFWFGFIPWMFIISFTAIVARTQAPLRFLLFSVGLSVFVWLSVSLWRCARNLTRPFMLFGFLARLWVAVNVLLAVLTVLNAALRILR